MGLNLSGNYQGVPDLLAVQHLNNGLCIFFVGSPNEAESKEAESKE